MSIDSDVQQRIDEICADDDDLNHVLCCIDDKRAICGAHCYNIGPGKHTEPDPRDCVVCLHTWHSETDHCAVVGGTCLNRNDRYHLVEDDT